MVTVLRNASPELPEERNVLSFFFRGNIKKESLRMVHSMWKIILLVALGISTLALDAKPFQSDSQYETDRDRKDREEYYEEKCCFSCRERPCRKIACFCVEEEQGPCRSGWFTPLRECVSCWGDSIKVDFLYWGAQNNAFIYALNRPSVDAASPSRITEHWSPGVRIALGREFCYDLWDPKRFLDLV